MYVCGFFKAYIMGRSVTPIMQNDAFCIDCNVVAPFYSSVKNRGVWKGGFTSKLPPLLFLTFWDLSQEKSTLQKGVFLVQWKRCRHHVTHLNGCWCLKAWPLQGGGQVLENMGCCFGELTWPCVQMLELRPFLIGRDCDCKPGHSILSVNWVFWNLVWSDCVQLCNQSSCLKTPGPENELEKNFF